MLLRTGTMRTALFFMVRGEKLRLIAWKTKKLLFCHFIFAVLFGLYQYFDDLAGVITTGMDAVDAA